MSQFTDILVKNYRSTFASLKVRRSEKLIASTVRVLESAMAEANVKVEYKTIVAERFLREQLTGWMISPEFLKGTTENEKPALTLIKNIYETAQDKFQPYFDFFRYKDELLEAKIPEQFKDDYAKFLELFSEEWNPQHYERCTFIYKEFTEKYDSKVIDDKWELVDRIPSLKKERSQPPTKPIHELEDFKIYKVNDAAEANHIFWKKGKKGNYWCVLGNGYATNYGGYPFYVVTHSTDVKETPFACYLPSYLSKDLSQSVRNKHNTGPVAPEDFSKIYPLLEKADKRITKYKGDYEKSKVAAY